MKKQLLLGALALCLAGGALAQEKTLRIGLEASYEPFTYKSPDGRLVGFEIDLAQALCAEIKARCSFVEQDFKGIIPALNARKFDVIMSSLTITEERKRAVAFTDKYYNTPSRLLARLSSKLSGAPDSLKGRRVGVLKGSTQERYAQKVYAPAGAVVTAYDTQQQIYLDLRANRLDATVADSVESALGFLKKPEGQGFGFIGPALRDAEIFGPGIGAAVRKADGVLRDELNAAIKTLRGNGGYQKISAKYFDFDVYGE